jgi:hypothetical protein
MWDEEKTIWRGFWSKRKCSPFVPIMTTCGANVRSTKKARMGRPVFGEGTGSPDQNLCRSEALSSTVSLMRGDDTGLQAG